MNRVHTSAVPASSYTSPSAPAPPPPTPRAATADADDHDDRHGEGTAISTFAGYQPSALPRSIVHAFNNINNTNKATSSGDDGTSANSSIILTGLDDDDDADDVDAPKQLQVPSHTSAACESNLLSTVAAPAIADDVAACLLPLISNTTHNNNNTTTDGNDRNQRSPALSPLQFEGVLLALQRHRRIFTGSEERAGFFLGDGAGIGKGTSYGSACIMITYKSILHKLSGTLFYKLFSHRHYHYYSPFNGTISHYFLKSFYFVG